MTPRPIIFLDIDGVLAHFGSNEELDPSCIAELDRLIVHTRARVLLTSAWRDRYGVEGTERRLVAAGFRGRLAGAIPSLPGRSRSEEINAYLNTVSRRVRFVILDDVPVDRPLLPHFVHIDDVTGLTSLDTSLAARLLRCPR
jgi:hypothetical protein